MGYDMRIRGEVPAAPQHDIDQAKDAWEAANAVLQARIRDGEFKGDFEAILEAAQSVDELWDTAYRLKKPGYFRLNNGGMGRYADAMHDLGMAHHSESVLDWAKSPDYPEDYDDNQASADAYDQAMDTFTGAHGSPADKPTIPMHKFSSNDGWFVTPEEIRAALAAWDAHDLDGLDQDTHATIETEYWGEFIAWLRLAA